MTIDFRNGVSTLKLIIYSPYLFATLYVCWRHGFKKNSGWIFLSIFCILRMMGASAQLATTSGSSKTPYTIAAVTDAIGLSPLLLASLSLISRAFYSILQTPCNPIFSITVIRIPELITTVAAILCIVGATSANNIANFANESTVHIGVILFMASFVLLLILTFGAGFMCRQTGKGEKALIIAVACSLPFVLVRLLYTVIACFGHDSSFNIVTGSVAINLSMAVLEEIVVVAIYTITGIKINVIPKDDMSDSVEGNLKYRAGRGDFGVGRLGLLSLLIGGVKDMTTLGEKEAIDSEMKGRETKWRVGRAPRYTERGQHDSSGPKGQDGMC